MPTRPPTTARRAVLALAATCLLVLGACSSGDDDDATTTTTEAGAASTTSAGSDGSSSDTTDDDTTTTEAGGDEPTTTTAGDDEPTGEAATFIAAAAESLTSALTDDEAVAACVARAWVDTIGFDRIAAADLDAEAFGQGDTEAWSALELSDAEAADVLASNERCDFDMVEGLRTNYLGANVDDGVDAACVEDALSDDLLESYLLGTFRGEDRSDDIVTEVSACSTEAE